MQKFIFFIILLVILIASCDTTKKTTDTNDNPKLEMVDRQEIIGTKWKLTMLSGRALDANSKQDIHFVLHENGKIAGSTGCNIFSGDYNINGGSQISFGQMLSTLQACFGLDVNESEIMQVFELTNNYTINGNMLMLNVGKRAPLAVFEATDS